MWIFNVIMADVVCFQAKGFDIFSCFSNEMFVMKKKKKKN